MLNYITIASFIFSLIVLFALWFRKPKFDRQYGEYIHQQNNLLWYVLGIVNTILIVSIAAAHVSFH